MSDPSEDIARKAAMALAPEVDASLPMHVEARLAGGGPGGGRFDAGITIAIASLVVSAASLAWTIYRDVRADAATKERLSRETRVKIELPPGLTTAQRDQVISVVVEEAIKAGDASSG